MGQLCSKKKKKECQVVDSLQIFKPIQSLDIACSNDSPVTTPKSQPLEVALELSGDSKLNYEFLIVKGKEHKLVKTNQLVFQLTAEIKSLNKSIGQLKTCLTLADAVLPRARLKKPHHLLDVKSKTRLKPNKSRLKRTSGEKVLLSVLNEAGDFDEINFGHLVPKVSRISIQRSPSLRRKVTARVDTASKSVQTQKFCNSKRNPRLDVFVIPNLVNIIPDFGGCGLESLVFKPLQSFAHVKCSK